MAGVADPNWLAYYNRNYLAERLRVSQAIGLKRGGMGFGGCGCLGGRSLDESALSGFAAPTTHICLVLVA